MRTVSEQWFWYMLVGFILGGGVVYLWMMLKAKSVQMRWYEWLMAVLGVLIFLLMGQTFIASLGEDQPQAAWMSLIFMGIPFLLLVVGTARSLGARRPKGAG